MGLNSLLLEIICKRFYRFLLRSDSVLERLRFAFNLLNLVQHPRIAAVESDKALFQGVVLRDKFILGRLNDIKCSQKTFIFPHSPFMLEVTLTQQD